MSEVGSIDGPPFVKSIYFYDPNGIALEIATWEEKQGPLLAAIGVEKGILNVLLFMIVGVAGFGILAIFSMIVVEKTRDIGILKALGASTAGIRGIFLGYGLLLGAVGSGVGPCSWSAIWWRARMSLIVPASSGVSCRISWNASLSTT